MTAPQEARDPEGDRRQVKEWCAVAARAAAAKQGQDTVILAVGRVLAITDAFVITSGSNVRQVRTIVEEVERQVGAVDGPKPLRIEGLDDARWILMDFGDFVVHVLSEEARDFYELERLWADAEVWEWERADSSDTSSSSGHPRTLRVDTVALSSD